MGKTNRKFNNEFKARVALEALKGHKTLSQIASEFRVHPTQINNWKKQALLGLKTAFTSAGKEPGEMDKKKADVLYKQIGKLQVENDFLKQAVYPGTA